MKDLLEGQLDGPATKSVALDGAASIQMLKPAIVKNFDEYAHQTIIPHLSTRLQTASCPDMGWDSFIAESLKCTARAKHGEEVCRHVVAAAAIPGNWQSFLHIDSNKTELLSILSEALLGWIDKKDKQLVITDGEGMHEAKHRHKTSTKQSVAIAEQAEFEKEFPHQYITAQF